MNSHLRRTSAALVLFVAPLLNVRAETPLAASFAKFALEANGKEMSTTGGK